MWCRMHRPSGILQEPFSRVSWWKRRARHITKQPERAGGKEANARKQPEDRSVDRHFQRVQLELRVGDRHGSAAERRFGENVKREKRMKRFLLMRAPVMLVAALTFLQ